MYVAQVTWRVYASPSSARITATGLPLELQVGDGCPRDVQFTCMPWGSQARAEAALHT